MTLRLVVVVMLSLVSFEAQAVVRYIVQNMSCAEVHQSLERDGTAILYRQGKTGAALYDRFVEDGSRCPAGYTATTERIVVADTDECGVSKCISARRFGGNE
jgi:hypothetical protein